MARRRVYEDKAVIAKAAELFARHGYRNITMDLLADGIGIAKPTLYVYGRSKQNLLEAVNLRFLEKVELQLEAALQAEGAGNKVKQIIRLWIELYVIDWSSIRVYHSEHKEISEEVRQVMRDRSAKIVDVLTGVIEDAKEDHSLVSDVPARFISWTILGTINWLPRWFQMENWSSEEASNYLIDMIFNGQSEVSDK